MKNAYTSSRLAERLLYHLSLHAAVDCGVLEPPLNGKVMLMGTTVGSLALYNCDLGHILLGSAMRKCDANGEWSGSEPVCGGKIYTTAISESCIREDLACYAITSSSQVLQHNYTTKEGPKNISKAN